MGHTEDFVCGGAPALVELFSSPGAKNNAAHCDVQRQQQAQEYDRLVLLS